MSFYDLHDDEWYEPNEVTQEEYDDAVSEDTTHCELCQRAILCGDNDCLSPESGGWAVCVQCAEVVSKLYRQALESAGVCEHGVPEGEWCGPCNKDYKAALTDEENNPTEPAP